MRTVSLLLAALAAAALSTASLAQTDDPYRTAAEVNAAASIGDVAAARGFLDAGFDVNYRRGNSTALGAAVIAGRAEMVRFLLSRGADPRTIIKDEYVSGLENGVSVLDYARKGGRDDIVAALLGAMGEAPAAIPVQAAPPAQAPAPAATKVSQWAAPASFAAGADILFTTSGGAEWRAGVVEKVGSGEFDRQYLIREANGSTHWVDFTRVTAPARQSYWTGYFVGDWDINTGIAVTQRTDGRDLYQIYTGGLRLPPLRINADGSYSWGVGGKLIKGRWTARTDAPGVVLLAGDRGVDWTVVNSTTRSTLDIIRADEIRLTSSVTSRIGHRIR
jgi:hypothetical protein